MRQKKPKQTGDKRLRLECFHILAAMLRQPHEGIVDTFEELPTRDLDVVTRMIRARFEQTPQPLVPAPPVLSIVPKNKEEAMACTVATIQSLNIPPALSSRYRENMRMQCMGAALTLNIPVLTLEPKPNSRMDDWISKVGDFEVRFRTLSHNTGWISVRRSGGCRGADNEHRMVQQGQLKWLFVGIENAEKTALAYCCLVYLPVLIEAIDKGLKVKSGKNSDDDVLYHKVTIEQLKGTRALAWEWYAVPDHWTKTGGFAKVE